jgi:2,4-dienoyl-CoA reductase-like NADH-dependent reductase (Old Yellow Enzyme family)/thioredoxin reductase
MDNPFEHLLSPVTINKMVVKNRIFVPPMGTNDCTGRGEPTDQMVQYFENIAKGGAGLIVMEVADVDGARRYNEKVLGIYDDFLIPAWKKITDAIHKYDARIVAQLIHAGPIPLFNDPSQLGPIGASPVPHVYNPGRIPHALTVDEIKSVTKLFVDAARRAKEAGCDGVEVHCAHNHGLLGAFVSPLHNKRTDEYGGDLFGLMKLPLEVIAAIRKEVGPDYPISVRISGSEMEAGGLTVDEICRMAKMFEKASVNYFDVSNGTLLDVKTVLPPTGTISAINAEYARRIKEVVKVPVGTVGRLLDPWIAEEVIASGKADIAFMGRAILCDHELPDKVKDGKLDDIRPCIGCSECVTSAMYGGATNCTLNSELGHESEGEIGTAEKKKKILIAGGGPGGLEAARVAALRGHDVTIMEKSDHLGGQFTIAAYPPTKQELTKGLKYQIREVDRLGVKIELNKTVTKQIAEEFGADAVIVATGGKPILPDWLKNGAHKRVVTAWEALRGIDNLGTNLLVIGGGQVGCETADYLAPPHYFMKPYDRKITIIEMLDNILIDDFSANRDLLVTRLLHKNIKIITGAKVEEILADGVTYTKEGQSHVLNGIDAIVCAMGTHPENSLLEELSGLSVPVIAIGDAQKPRKIMHAVYEGAKAAKAL